MTGDVDVAVVGAGAAGLAAGLRLREAGVRSVVLEAAGRTGGRAYTDTTSFDSPWDLGCHWLHSAETNPFVPIADRLGFTYRSSNAAILRRLHLTTHWASAAQAEDALASVDAAFDAIRAAGEAGQDVPASEVLPASGPWAPLVRHWIGLMTASPPERVSTRDFAAYADGHENWPVLAGYGALVRANAADLPVVLGCPVSHIDWSADGVRLATPRGTVRARAVIVTVSTAVIANERLTFTPALPEPLMAAFHALPLGVSEKVAIGFDRDLFGVTERVGINTFDPARPDRMPVNFQIIPGPRPLVVAHMAGDPGGALVAEGAEAMAQFALDAIAAAFGTSVRAHVTGTVATGWVADPLIGGGYSGALPGAAVMRARLLDTLTTPLGARILFAGEAVSEHAFSTCHGAHLSGRTAADRAVSLLELAA